MIKKITMIILVLFLVFPILTFASTTTEHWVYPELKPYKQRIVKFKDGSSTNGPITQEEWKSFHYNVLNDENLDEPIEIYHWATMIKMGVVLPEGQEDQWIDSYVYNLVPMYARNIDRETAVGGLIKLLSSSIVNASWSNTEADAAKVFIDFGEISDKHKDLVRIAYRDGLLDSMTKERFRSKDNITNAEAISIMEKVMLKYEEAVPIEKKQTSESKVESIVYTVNKGDVLYRIGLKYSIRWQELAKYNNLKNPHLILIGQKILIPFSSKLETSVIGNSASCNEPPKVLKWSSNNYHLKNIKTKLEPGMKFGFIKCQNGMFTLGDDEPGRLGVYSNGDPRTNNDLLLFGTWGRTLYTMETR